MKTNEQNQAFKEATIAQLQRQILPLQGLKALSTDNNISLGFPSIENAFPNAVFPIGCTHELLSATAEDIAVLATIYNLQEKYAQSGKMYDQAYTIRRKVLGPTHKDTLASLSSLVSYLSFHGNQERARKLCESGLQDIKADPKSDPLYEADFSHELGKILMPSDLVEAKSFDQIGETSCGTQV